MKLPKDQLAETNDLNPILTEMEASLNDLKEEMDSKVEMEDMPSFPTEITVSNLPEVQRVEITNLPEEKDDSEQVQTLKDIKEAIAAFSSKDVNLAQVESLLSDLIQMSSSEEEIDLRPKFDELKAILNTLNDNVASIETPIPFDYLKLAEIIRENVKIRGGGSAGVEYVKNVAGQQINPSTEEKQDALNTIASSIQTATEGTNNTVFWLKSLIRLLKPLSIVTGAGSNRLSIDVNSGTITTVTTVTTVSTVANQTNLGNVSGFVLQQSSMRNAFANGIRRNLS